jgi:glycerol-3-phosphate dehydrogenase
MNREAALQRLKSEAFDIVVIGGGATGLGCALDAAARGYRTALIEAQDFAKGTSSRSTKLIHGGVRYLQQGNVALVREALHERTLLRANAPALVRELEFFIPATSWWQRIYYGAGLRFYDALSGDSGFPRSRTVARGLTYWDAQFDDARLAIALARTAVDCGAAVANYVRACAFRYANGAIEGIDAVDEETHQQFSIAARVVVNAAGVFSDELRKLDDCNATALLRFSRGSHIVVAGSPLPNSESALLVPRTADGRVVFAIPWYGHTLIGTTDVPVSVAEIEPQPASDEISYLLATINPYLQRWISATDIRSAFAGLRPLIDRSAASTARLSREHVVEVSRSGLVTIAGGKWTTYRKMAQDAIDGAERQGKLGHVPCPTAKLRLRDETAQIALLDEAQRIRHFVEHEMGRTVEDILARRMRTLFVDAEAALAAAPACAHVLAEMLCRDDAWEQDQRHAFTSLASHYFVGNAYTEAKTP